MLIDFSVNNFRSIKQMQTLSFAKGTGDEHLNNTFAPSALKTTHLLKSLAIYGANASGKSNLIKALAMMQDIVESSAKDKQADEKIVVEPFVFDDESVNLPTEFEVNFICNEVRYQYGFSTTQKQIIEEWLFAYPKGRPQRWFERTYDTNTDKTAYKFGDSLTGQKSQWSQSTRNNALFLSTAVQLNSQQLKPLYGWFKNELAFSGPSGWSPNFTANMCLTNAEFKTQAIRFLKAADIELDDLDIKTRAFDALSLPEELPEDIRIHLAKELNGSEIIEQIQFIRKTQSGKLVQLKIEDESDGTRKLFAFAGPWIDALLNGHIFIIDELHNSLHPKLVEYLINLFHNPQSNPNNAQLIFTTHETSILNQDIFRRDQIWFCEKTEELATEVFSLVEFNPRKGRDNLEAGYLSGRYGALPFTTQFTPE